MLGLLPKGNPNRDLFIKPKELVSKLTNFGFVAGPQTGLGPRVINRIGYLFFVPLPL